MSEQAEAEVPGNFPSLLFEGPATSQAALEVRKADDAFARDLNLDQVVAAIVGNSPESALITGVLVSPLRDPAAVRYRQDVFRDLDDHALLDAFLRFSGDLSQVRTQLRQLPDLEFTHHREAWLLDAAVTYCAAVRALATKLESARPGSRALAALRDYLAAYVSAPGFAALAADTRDRRAELEQVRYCVRIRGDRVEVSRYEGEADYSAVVLGVFERFKQDAVRDYRIAYRGWPGMNHIAEEIATLVARLFPGEFTALAQYCRAHASFLDEGIRRVHAELQFYLAYLGYIQPLRAAGLPFCYAELPSELSGAADSPPDVSADDTFDLALARKLVRAGKPVVTNDVRLSGAERIIVVTGPNQGGKTTFARAVGQLHHLAATGCPVPGRAARLFLPDRIFTNFGREEDLARMTGKLEDDLARVGEIVQSATGDSLLILNETFSSTTLADARFLGTKLLTKVMRLGARCVYVTFVDELAALGEQVVSMMSTVDPADPARRTFKVVRKPADGLAYALAIAEKYDLTYERLSERLSR